MTYKNELFIIGASGHGRVVADIALKMSLWNRISFLDDNEEIKASMGIEVKDNSSSFMKYLNTCDIFVAIGNNAIRRNILKQLEHSGASIPTLIHPNAIIGEKVEIGKGTVIMAGAVINCSSIIGSGCIINTGATIDHDNVINDYVHISPGVHTAGTVHIGRGSWMGIGSIVSNNVNIASECIIGAGGVVISDIYEAGTYVGVPVRRIELNGQDINISK